MIILELEIPGVFVIDIEPHLDERGSFARVFCTEELAARGLETHVAQRSVSANPRQATLRGLHLQVAPHEETKLVRCTRGSVYDVMVDLRTTSPTLGTWTGLELRSDECRSVYVPPGVAHGFLTLEDDTWMDYTMSVPYVAQAAAGIRWDDPAIGVDWPIAPQVISDRDRLLPTVDFDQLRSGSALAR